MRGTRRQFTGCLSGVAYVYLSSNSSSSLINCHLLSISRHLFVIQGFPLLVNTPTSWHSSSVSLYTWRLTKIFHQFFGICELKKTTVSRLTYSHKLLIHPPPPHTALLSPPTILFEVHSKLSIFAIHPNSFYLLNFIYLISIRSFTDHVTNIVVLYF